MATDEAIRELEAGVGTLRRRTVEIVVTARSSQTPVVASAAGVPGLTARTLQLVGDGVDGKELAVSVGREPENSAEGKPDPKEPRRVGWMKARRAEIVTGGATLGSAGALLPAMVVHGSAQLALATGAGALLGVVAGRVADLMSRGKKAP